MPKGVRATDQRTITVSVPKSLVQEIDDFAAAEHRSRSNWIVKELAALLEKKRAVKIKVLPRVAEDEGCYPNPKKKNSP